MQGTPKEARTDDYAPGEVTGLNVPAHIEALRAAGPAFLTESFRAFGALAADNAVTRVLRLEPFLGGNSGLKAALTVEYARADPGLHTELFVKFSRDLTDAFRDRRRHELHAEVRLAELSRLPGFPVAVPKAYFADFDPASGTGVLITEQIAFGKGAVEPLKRKCMDHELAEPLAYYRAIVRALAKLVAGHKSGRLSPQLEELFPYDRDAAAAEMPIPYDEAGLRERIRAYARFAETCPRLLGPELREPDFIARLEEEAVRIRGHEAAIKRFLHADPDFVALCHWNTNIDNAWFWRDAAGELQAGLLDWGMVRQMNVGYALWGGLCGAGPEIWNQHLDELLLLFCDTLAAEGGPRLDLARLRVHLDMSVAMLGLALLVDAPALVLSRLPEAPQAADPLDPIMFRNEVARSFLHVFKAFLNVWRTHDMAASLDVVLAEA